MCVRACVCVRLWACVCAHKRSSQYLGGGVEVRDKYISGKLESNIWATDGQPSCYRLEVMITIMA